ncbi:MAG: metal-dependent hydrolase [Nanoarchaeota archaeon]
MSNPSTHALISIILIEIFREYYVKKKEDFPRYYVLIGAIAGILPDLDFIAYFILYSYGYTLEQLHRTFLHSIFFILILTIIGIIILKLKFNFEFLDKKNIQLSYIFIIFAIASFIHVLFDMFNGGVMFFYPISHILIGTDLILLLPQEINWSISYLIDTFLLFFWLCWMEFKLKINRYF